MYHKIVDSWLASILGVFGYGLAQINLHFSDTVLKFVGSMIAAAVAGYVGYLGKLLAVWSVRKINSLKAKK